MDQGYITSYTPLVFLPPNRHPSNLMLDRLTGRILHIDFGDCFEVAMTREKFPEKIPFRLTRMLTNAMEVIIYNKHILLCVTVHVVMVICIPGLAL